MLCGCYRTEDWAYDQAGGQPASFVCRIDLPVVMMSETTRLAKHGLALPSKSKNKLQDIKTAAVRRSASGNLSATQQSTLSKQKAKLLSQDFLHSTMQAGSICSKLNNSAHQDELAATVLQALSHASPVRLTPPPALAASNFATSDVGIATMV